MSKDVEWGAMYGEGDIVCTCDNCGEEFRYPFEDKQIDYREAQQASEDEGWTSCIVSGACHDFCCEECRNQ